MRITFDLDDLNYLYPAHILVKKQRVIQAFGPAIARHVPTIKAGQLLDHHFVLISKAFDSLGDAILTRSARLRLRAKSNGLTFEGRVVATGDIFFLALNIASAPEEFDQVGVRMSDLAPADPFIDTMLLLSMQKAMLTEARELAGSLALERQKTEALLEKISRVSSYLAHDFNNHLSIIKLNCDRLTSSKLTFDYINRISAIIKTTADRSSGIAKSLMTLTSANVDTRTDICIDDIILESSPYFNSVLDDRITLKLALAARGVLASVAPAGLVNCLTNILLNSRDAISGRGGITISTYTEGGSLPGNGMSDEGQRIVIEISDTGVGMDEVVAVKAFEPYFSTKANGSGIGLASVMDFMAAQDGSIELQSRPGLGTRAILRFPMVKQESATLPAQHKPWLGLSVSRPEQLRLLVVDDELYALEALVELLEGQGFFVAFATEPKEGLELVQRHQLEGQPFHILLTDVVMPQGSGVELGHAAQAASPQLRIILMSGLAPSEGDLDRAWQFLAKPLKLPQLFKVLQSMLPTSPGGEAKAC